MNTPPLTGQQLARLKAKFGDGAGLVYLTAGEIRGLLASVDLLQYETSAIRAGLTAAEYDRLLADGDVDGAAGWALRYAEIRSERDEARDAARHLAAKVADDRQWTAIRTALAVLPPWIDDPASTDPPWAEGVASTGSPVGDFVSDESEPWQSLLRERNRYLRDLLWSIVSPSMEVIQARLQAHPESHPEQAEALAAALHWLLRAVSGREATASPRAAAALLALGELIQDSRTPHRRAAQT